MSNLPERNESPDLIGLGPRNGLLLFAIILVGLAAIGLTKFTDISDWLFVEGVKREAKSDWKAMGVVGERLSPTAPKRALAVFTEAQRLMYPYGYFEDWAWFHRAKARSLLAMNNLDQAEQELLLAADALKNNYRSREKSEVWDELANIYFLEKRYTKARDAWINSILGALRSTGPHTDRIVELKRKLAKNYVCLNMPADAKRYEHEAQSEIDYLNALHETLSDRERDELSNWHVLNRETRLNAEIKDKYKYDDEIQRKFKDLLSYSLKTFGPLSTEYATSLNDYASYLRRSHWPEKAAYYEKRADAIWAYLR